MERKTGLRRSDIEQSELLDYGIPIVLDGYRCTNLLQNSEHSHQVCATRNPLLGGNPMIVAQTFVCAMTTEVR
jgi:hypothetical protein